MKRALTESAAAFALLGAGCASPHEAIADGESRALIGGITADAASLDAIGALALIDSIDDGRLGDDGTRILPVCTATLIAPQTIVTAKHCIQLMRRQQQSPDASPHFLIGADWNHPKRRIEILGWNEASSFDGGWAKNGHDVAVMLLAERVTDVQPVRIETPTAVLQGKRLAAVGYGARNNQKQSGSRAMGNVTFNAVGGRAYEAMFGSFESFRAWYLEGEPTAEPGEELVEAPSEASLHATYEQTQLLADYEAHAGARPGDVQPCFGDSGGPLLDVVDGALVSYGVLSGGVPSQRSICDYGSVYATFGPDTRALIEDTLAWKDPCDGLSTRGVCEDSVARRCTRTGEGPRRIIVSDCATLGQTCTDAASGGVRCIEPGETAVALP